MLLLCEAVSATVQQRNFLNMPFCSSSHNKPTQLLTGNVVCIVGVILKLVIISGNSNDVNDGDEASGVMLLAIVAAVVEVVVNRRFSWSLLNTLIIIIIIIATIGECWRWLWYNLAIS